MAGFHVPARGRLPDESRRRRQVLHAGDALRQSQFAERHRRQLGPAPLLHFPAKVEAPSNKRTGITIIIEGSTKT